MEDVCKVHYDWIDSNFDVFDGRVSVTFKLLDLEFLVSTNLNPQALNWEIELAIVRNL